MSSVNGDKQISFFDPSNLLNDLDEVREQAKKSIQDALVTLGTIISTGTTGTDKSGAPKIPPPKSNILGSMTDITVRIGLLQDALNQLQQQVTKLQIEQRMNEMHSQNKLQLDKINDQLKQAEEAYRKSQEAKQKGNIFKCICDWISVAFDFISLVVNVVTAVGYALSGNVVSAGAMIAAAAATAASLACNLTLAIDSTMKAAGNDGFLSDKQRNDLKIAAQVLGYVAMAASLIGGVGALMVGLKSAIAGATKELAKHGVKMASSSIRQQVLLACKDSLKELAGQTAKMGVKSAAQQMAYKGAKEAWMAILKPLVQHSIMAGAFTALRDASLGTAKGVGGHMVANLTEDAAKAQREAELAEAQAKAIEAQIQLLRKMIEELEKQMEDLLQSSLDCVAAIYNAIDESQQSMETIFHSQTA